MNETFGSKAGIYRNWLDRPRENAIEWYEIRVEGWALPPDEFKHIEIMVDRCHNKDIKFDIKPRFDLKNAFSQIPKAEFGGFAGSVLLGDKEGTRELVANAVGLDGKRHEIARRNIINSKSSINKYYKKHMSQLVHGYSLKNIWYLFSRKKEFVRINVPDVIKTQWYNKDQITDLQEHLLRRLINYAYNYIPYYRLLFKENR